MNELVKSHNGIPVTTQSIIAKYSENSDESIQRLIRTHKESLEKFGTIEFETVDVKNSKNRVNSKKIYYLNEQQSYLFMTFLKNTEIVKKFKIALIKEFFKMKDSLHVNNNGVEQLQETILQQNAIIADLQKQLQLPKKTIKEDDIVRVKQAINHKLKNTIRIKTNDMIKNLNVLIDFATNDIEKVLRDADISEDLTWYDQNREHFKKLLQ